MQTGDNSLGMSFSELVFSDLARHRPGARASWLTVLTRIPSNPGLLASVLLRAQQVLARSGRLRTAGLLRTLGNTLVGADFGPGMVVGPGLALVHPVGVTMGFGARVGDNVTFAGGVVLAARYYEPQDSDEPLFATIEDGAAIGAHAVLVGPVRIGKNAVVGANTVVLSDVPDNAIVMGTPAKRIGNRAVESND